MNHNYVAGGPGRALLFLGEQLYAVGNTLNSNAIHFSITAEDIRGGRKNVLLAQYFHDPGMSIDLTNVLFNFGDLALATGNTIEQGGLSLKEEATIITANGTATLTQTPVAPAGMGGQIHVWYKKPTDRDWKDVIYTTGATVTIPGATQGDTYCLKYFWNNENARSMTLKAAYEPSEIQLVLIQDLYPVEVQKGVTTPGAKAGNFITICPRYKLNGTTDLDFSAGSVVGTSLSGNVLAVDDENSCEGEQIFGYMTQEIFSEKWQDNVVALAVENADLDMSQNDTEALIVRAVFGNGMASQRKDNSNFTFTKVTSPAATATALTVGANDGVVSAGAQAGVAVIEVSLTDVPNVSPAFVNVTVV